MPISSLPELSTLAVIGGSGLYQLGLGPLAATHAITTPFSPAPVLVAEETLATGTVLFLPRHGDNHAVAPHRINYRANLWALHKLGASCIIAVNCVGGITPGMIAGRLVIPDQLIDYSHGREHTFFTGDHSLDQHIEFTNPYDAQLAMVLAKNAKQLHADFCHGGVYGCTQGPRLETAAEIRRLQRDGCDIVGMTGMPEAALARELGLRYAALALVVNRAAGMGGDSISLPEMKTAMQSGMVQVRQVLARSCNELMSVILLK